MPPTPRDNQTRTAPRHFVLEPDYTISTVLPSVSSRMTTFRHPDSGSVTIADDGSSGSDAM